MSSSKPKTVDNGKFKLTEKIGGGCFGEVYLGQDTRNNNAKVAIKLENSRQTTSPQLKHEAEILRELCKTSSPQGFTEVHAYCKEGVFNCLVMECLGKSLEGHLSDMGGTFTTKTTVMLADQILQRIEYLHSKGFVHRDIKSENFTTGEGSKQHHIFLIDFGLSKKFWERNAHIEEKKHLSLTGTARYASINALKGMEQSRRDDLEAIAHMLIYFIAGKLPWSGLEAKTQTEKYQKIMKRKETEPIDKLCAGMPSAFPDFLREARGMTFRQRPDYARLREAFVAVRRGMEKDGPIGDHEFDWNECNDTSILEPLVVLTSLPHPDDASSAAKGAKKPSGRGGCCCFGGSKTLD